MTTTATKSTRLKQKPKRRSRKNQPKKAKKTRQPKGQKQDSPPSDGKTRYGKWRVTANPLAYLPSGDEMKPRWYQDECINEVFKAYNEGKSTALISLTMGTGKTFISDLIIKRWVAMLPELIASGHPEDRFLFLVDRQELALNAYTRFKATNPADAHAIGLLCGSLKSYDLDKKITVALVQSLDNDVRWSLYNQHGPTRLVIIDEAHRAFSYENLLKRVKADNPHHYLLGMTATPYRRDKKKLVGHPSTGAPFECLPYAKGVAWAVKNKILTPMEVEPIKVNFNGKEVSIADLYEKDPVQFLASVRRTIVNFTLDGQGIIFTESVAMAQQIAEFLNQSRIPSRFAYSQTTSTERKEILDGFKAGEVQVLVCYPGLWGEGLDLPMLKWVLMLCSPHLGLAMQCLGRAWRLFDGKIPVPSEMEIFDENGKKIKAVPLAYERGYRYYTNKSEEEGNYKAIGLFAKSVTNVDDAEDALNEVIDQLHVVDHTEKTLDGTKKKKSEASKGAVLPKVDPKEVLEQIRLAALMGNEFALAIERHGVVSSSSLAWQMSEDSSIMYLTFGPSQGLWVEAMNDGTSEFWLTTTPSPARNGKTEKHKAELIMRGSHKRVVSKAHAYAQAGANFKLAGKRWGWRRPEVKADRSQAWLLAAEMNKGKSKEVIGQEQRILLAQGVSAAQATDGITFIRSQNVVRKFRTHKWYRDQQSS